ncbi:carbon-nitrogen hydrolase family protein [Leisingera aquaemixtae]|uniref:carbon-nitrogen hydrolase family protein n=1 Tax=Leisingera aquaemixtae TaxID=1396826 RepID=UPI0021A27578|nr:carbon-nitrogen hydrolase family protein [Leisingera aquaemixtae]UWQ24966.1 carbon-nitrogen hydrolase family protein [Leisingera aquaemixtae]
MRITIADWDPRPEARAAQAAALAAHAAAEQSDMILLPEMPLCPWLAASPERDAALWEQSVRDHESGLDDLGALAGTALAGSRPVLDLAGQPLNRAFLWQDARIAAEPHEKAALPDEEGYWESRWYDTGRQQAVPLDWNGVRLGFAICTELWDWDHACRLSRAGADVLLVPRATPDLGSDVWIAGARALAVRTGCYVLSSNFAYPGAAGFDFEGLSVAADPDGGLLAATCKARPYATVSISVSAARQAKAAYPRYILDKMKEKKGAP